MLEDIEKRYLKAGAHYVVEGTWELPEVIESVNDRLAKGMLPSDFKGK